MSVTLVNSHVLFPHQADWNQKPKWERLWNTKIDEAITGAEKRLSARPASRIKLSVLVVPFNHIESAKLSDRVRSAKSIGLAAIPYHGRGSKLTADVSSTAVAIANTDWTWTIGDKIIFMQEAWDSFDRFDVRTLTNVAGLNLTLDSAVSNGPYLSGTFCWPLLFGKFTTGDMNAVTDYRNGLDITVTQV